MTIKCPNPKCDDWYHEVSEREEQVVTCVCGHVFISDPNLKSEEASDGD